MWMVRSSVVVSLALLLLGSSACRRLPRSFRPRVHRPVVAVKQLPLLAGFRPLETLALESFESSLVAVPVGARFARPVVVALHGKSDSPLAACRTWSAITDSSYFVLCPALSAKASKPEGAGEACSQWECAASELKEALVALRKRFGDYIAPKEVMLAGYGRGASLAVPLAQQNPSVFSRLWLVDGGMPYWSSTFSSTYVERGGKLLAIACTEPACQADASRIIASAHAVGLSVADYRSAKGTGEFTPDLENSLKATWATARPKTWPWTVPNTSNGKKTQ